MRDALPSSATDEAMEIQAKATYDKATLRKFAFADLKKMKAANLILIIIVSLGLLFSLLDMLLLDGSPIMFFVLLAVTGSYFIYLYLLIPYLATRQLKTASPVKNEYVFTETKFTAASSSAGFSGTSEIEYSMLFKTVESKEFFYLYVSKNQAMIVDKGTVTESEAETIRQTIMFVLGKKYKII